MIYVVPRQFSLNIIFFLSVSMMMMSHESMVKKVLLN